VISPWTVYWIMQLSTIKLALILLPVASFFVVGFLGCATDGDAVYDERAGKFLKWTKIWLAWVIACFAIAPFVPSSKTAAAMVLIPAIANNETVQKEAGELYQLAKDGLKELVKPEEKK